MHIGDEARLQAFAKGEDLLAQFEASPRQCGTNNDGTKFMASYLGFGSGAIRRRFFLLTPFLVSSHQRRLNKDVRPHLGLNSCLVRLFEPAEN